MKFGKSCLKNPFFLDNLEGFQNFTIDKSALIETSLMGEALCCMSESLENWHFIAWAF